MKTVSKLAIIGVTGTALAFSMVSPVYAWHPEGKITKSVQNLSARGDLKDADDAAGAVSAQPGETLRYSITVSNPAKPADQGHNDLAFIVMTDSLPSGVELIDNPSKRIISADLGTLKPGQSVTKTYLVKVNTNIDGAVIDNKACFTGDSLVKDSPQKGCDNAVVKVTVPKSTSVVTAAAPVTPDTPAAQQPTVLPATGPASLFALGGLAVIAGYAANLMRLRSRASRA